MIQTWRITPPQRHDLSITNGKQKFNSVFIKHSLVYFLRKFRIGKYKRRVCSPRWSFYRWRHPRSSSRKSVLHLYILFENWDFTTSLIITLLDVVLNPETMLPSEVFNFVDEVWSRSFFRRSLEMDFTEFCQRLRLYTFKTFSS